MRDLTIFLTRYRERKIFGFQRSRLG